MTSKIPVAKNNLATPVSDRKVVVATAPVTSIEETVVVDHTISGNTDEKDDKLADLVRLCTLANRLKAGSVLHSPGIQFIPRFGGRAGQGMPDLAVSAILATGFPISVNTAAGKYLQFLNGASYYTISNVGSSSEFSSFGSIFDEFFVHKAEFKYQPLNRHSANAAGNAILATAAGAPGLVNTLGASLVCLQHNQAVYPDVGSAWYSSSVAAGSQWIDLGDPFTVTWRNNEKFSWKGPVGDQTTTRVTQAWCSIAQSADYGGVVQLVTPEASGAAAGIGTLAEGGVFGHCLVHYYVSFRARS